MGTCWESAAASHRWAARACPQRLLALVLLVVAGATASANADGYFMWREKVPPSIPYQRALIIHHDTVETLVLQSRYQLPAGSTSSPLGWVVPVPAVPELASMPSDAAKYLFFRLSLATTPSITRVSVILGTVLAIVASCTGILLLVLPTATREIRALQRFKPRFPRTMALVGTLMLMGTCVLFAVPGLAKGASSSNVEAVVTKSVGIYDVTVIRSGSSSDLLAWLNERNFKFGENTKAAFDSYIDRGWCFVVAEVRPENSPKADDAFSEGLADPLVLRFSHPDPIYPMVLTGSGGFDTEVLIYLIADHAMTAGGALPVRFADTADRKQIEDLLRNTAFSVEPAGFLDSTWLPEDGTSAMMCKFKGTLTPAQMSQDLVFHPAPNDEFFREHKVMW